MLKNAGKCLMKMKLIYCNQIFRFLLKQLYSHTQYVTEVKKLGYCFTYLFKKIHHTDICSVHILVLKNYIN